MSIITISRGSYSMGKEVAEKVAAKLGYRCLSREVILDASDLYQIPEIKLVKAIHDSPTILGRIGGSKKAYVAYYQSALAGRVKDDNVVYHGMAGHVLLKGIPHVLKVRIIAELEDRVAIEMKRENVTRQEALSKIKKDDEERRKWTQSLYGVDPWDSSLYDLVVHIHKFTIDDAVNIICDAANLNQFNATKESQQKMDDLALASRVKAILIERHFDVSVLSESGNILIYTKGDDRLAGKIEEALKKLHESIDGINHIEIHQNITPHERAI
ncbi:MAG: cytidylate kinase-like family protein [Deltaproteobacteria bacterium]|nr:cytidylate kinase-like family protein [Deltaproteobacteria bacterium]